MAAKLFTPQLIRRGLEVFFLISLAGFAFTFIYGKNPQAVLDKALHLHWWWLLVGVLLASMDWIGGGLRLWAVARVVHPNPPIGGMMLAGGMSAWAAYLTPLQSGAAPMMIYTMRRFGIPVPVALTSTLMTFIATIIFFGVAGPLAILFGGGRSLGGKDAVLGLSLYDLYLGTLSVFMVLGVVLIAVIIFPKHMSALVHKVADWAGRRSTRVAARLEGLRTGIDQAHESVVAFNTPRGWLALLWATLLSAPSHANKLLAGYVAMRTLGIHANFVDILLLQTLITFLLYFAPTPGASGIAEVLSALIMAAYVPKELTPLYILIWRLILSYFTIGFGFFVFTTWVRHGLKGISTEGDEGVEAA